MSSSVLLLVLLAGCSVMTNVIAESAPLSLLTQGITTAPIIWLTQNEAYQTCRDRASKFWNRERDIGEVEITSPDIKYRKFTGELTKAVIFIPTFDRCV